MSSGKLRFTLRGKIPYLCLAAVIVAADQVSKWLIARSLTVYQSTPVIPGFFRFTHVRNSGAVWGFFSHLSHGWVPKVITLMAILAFLLVIYYFLKLPISCRPEILAFAFVLAGAIGNITDRIRLGYVIDFIELYLGRFHWPTFNVADTFISAGVVLLAWCIWRGKCSQF